MSLTHNNLLLPRPGSRSPPLNVPHPARAPWLAGQRLQSCPFSKHGEKNREIVGLWTFCPPVLFCWKGWKLQKNWDVLQKPVLCKNQKRKLFARLGKKIGKSQPKLRSWEVSTANFPSSAFCLLQKQKSSGFPHIELNTKLLWTPFLQDLLALLHLHLPFGRRSSNKQTTKNNFEKPNFAPNKSLQLRTSRMPVVFKI